MLANLSMASHGHLMGQPNVKPVVEQADRKLSVILPAANQDPTDTVIALTLDGPAEAEMQDGNPL